MARQGAHARSIAEPYLRLIAPAVHAKLTLGVEPVAVKGFGMPSLKPANRRTFWPLGATFNNPGGRISAMTGNMLCLTGDGYFTKNPRLSGPDGFEDLLASIYLLPNPAGYPDVSHETPLCVEQGTDRVCIALQDYEQLLLEGGKVNITTNSAEAEPIGGDRCRRAQMSMR